MKYNIEITRKAVKQINKIQLKDRKKIFIGIRGLENSTTWGDVKKLVNHQYGYRLRVGNYRVSMIFQLKKLKKETIEPIEVK